MKKTVFAGLCITGMLFLAGCTDHKTKENKSTGEKSEEQIPQKQQSMNSEIGKEKKLNGIKMKITEVNFVEDDSISEDEKLLQVKFDINNAGEEGFGIGSGDFYIQDQDGKKYEMYGREDNFGNLIQPNESLQGNGYYKIAKDAKELVVVYSPIATQGETTKDLNWKIGNPET
ncbi:DUF4352 domain-containing protein [Bacillus cereus]|nr:DUF4352 domain-containing protein [Bacillus cereus]MEB9570804.1 DUF4352 domain-containing protein [Bacillus cereus]